MDSNQHSHFASLVRSSSQSASCFAAARMTCCSLRFRLASSATGSASAPRPIDVFTSQMIIGSESKYDQDKNQDHREGDPDFCVVTVGLEPTVSLRFARSVKFAIGVQPPWCGVCTCCSLRFRLASSRTAGASAPRPNRCVHISDDHWFGIKI